MKLVLTRKDSPHGCIRASWAGDDPDISWISLFYDPTEDERQTGWNEDATHLTIIIDEFSRAAVRSDDHVYAVLGTPFQPEYEGWLEGLRRSGQVFVKKDDLDTRRGLLRRLFLPKGEEKYVYVSQVTRQNVSAWFSNRGGGMEVIPFIFLISSKPIDEWVRELEVARNLHLDKQFLARVGRVMLNHWEHGVELIGMHVDVGPFETVARELSSRLQVPLEVRDFAPYLRRTT